MSEFIVTFLLEATDHAAAEAAAGGWAVTPGATLQSITGTTVPATPGLPQTVPPSGNVGDAIEAAEGLALYELAPSSVPVGAGTVQLHLHGYGYTTAAQIVFDGTALATAFVSDTELYCSIDAKVGGRPPGTYDVLVRQNGQQTKALPFTIAAA